MRHIYNLLIELVHETYRKLIWLSLKYCDKFQFVLPHHINHNSSVREVIKKFAKFQLSNDEVSEWPGTKLLKGTATLYRYNLNKDSASQLIDSNKSLYSWAQPDFPEDLCLIRADNTSWLASISYEKDGYFELTKNEIREIQELIPELIISKYKVDRVD